MINNNNNNKRYIVDTESSGNVDASTTVEIVKKSRPDKDMLHISL